MHVRLQCLIVQERMHGGTDMALAIQTASKHMQTALPPGGLQTLLVLSDGCIDKYQGISCQSTPILVRHMYRHAWSCQAFVCLHSSHQSWGQQLTD